MLSTPKLILTAFRLIYWFISDHRAGEEREELPLHPSKPGKLKKQTNKQKTQHYERSYD